MKTPLSPWAVDATAWSHGGVDALGAPRHDFSTNSNACGPCPAALAAVQAADATRYPDPAYTALCQCLADFHQVSAERVLLAASASEAIFRLTAWAHQQGVRSVHLPVHYYGDYARAAQAWGLQRAVGPAGVVAGVLAGDAADGVGERTVQISLVAPAPVRAAATSGAPLIWACEPSSPLGQAHTGWPCWLVPPGLAGDQPASALLPVARQRVEVSAPAWPLLVLDSAYAPLRLSGQPSLNPAQLGQVWQLFTPNKALGLTGVRAAYLIAPCGADTAVQALQNMAPSWPVGAHGVAMLQAWVTPEVQGWLADSLHTLRDWKERQIALLQEAGWQVAPSDANYFCARPPHPLDLAALRADHGIKLRDATSFGLPGWFRLGVLGPQAQAALAAGLSGTRC